MNRYRANRTVSICGNVVLRKGEVVDDQKFTENWIQAFVRSGDLKPLESQPVAPRENSAYSPRELK